MLECLVSFWNPHVQEENFLGGPLREKSLKDTAQTAICLVWARPDSMEWLLM